MPADTLRTLNARLSALGDELDAALASGLATTPDGDDVSVLVERYEALAREQSAALTAHLEAQREEIAAIETQARAIRRHLDGTASEPEPAQAPVDTALVLRYCRADRSSHGGFTWPESGPVSCPDWRDNRECGNGLHGWLWGEGDAGVWEHRPDDIGMVGEVAVADLRDLSGKVKYQRGVVVFCGAKHAAADYILAHGGAGRAVIGAIATAGARGTATAGDDGTATAGYAGTIQLSLWDSATDRRRIKTAYVGEDGIEPGVAYRLDAAGAFVRAVPS